MPDDLFGGLDEEVDETLLAPWDDVEDVDERDWLIGHGSLLRSMRGAPGAPSPLMTKSGAAVSGPRFPDGRLTYPRAVSSLELWEFSTSM
ncbi:hypothetical protein GCM10028833_05680 [Glycomyces tarimensis]